jgi:hypothetical protein
MSMKSDAFFGLRFWHECGFCQELASDCVCDLVCWVCDSMYCVCAEYGLDLASSEELSDGSYLWQHKNFS